MLKPSHAGNQGHCQWKNSGEILRFCPLIKTLLVLPAPHCSSVVLQEERPGVTVSVFGAVWCGGDL
jgi:hypothetical protein